MTPESNPRKPSHAERLYRRLLRLLPGDFRHDFGDSMAADFADRRRDSAGGARALMLLREFGGLLRALVRQWIGDVGRDLRFAIRLLARTKTVTLAALGMLAVGTGANVAVFSIVDAVMLRTPFDQPERMFFVRMAGGNSGNPTAAIPKALLPALQRLDGLEAVAAVWGGSPTYRGAGIEAHRLNLECVSAGFFAVTGARPLLGRPFAAAEDVASALPIFVASYDFWRRELNSDPKVIGRVLNLDNRPVTIIGVMPRGFNGAYSRNHVDGWAPIGPALNRPGPSGCAVGPFVNVMVRTRSDASVPAIESALTALSNANGAVHPKGALSSVLGDTVDDVRMPLLILMGAVACVLFIACANVANLLVERALGRRRELAMRLALGATRDRVFRQAIVETL
ncbi:MAG TPA: ABC transporter permease, partial [Vicinamibacterales bacterium]|nr:ABC transporter permease [Vicinamibacterales bacterium]